MTNQFEVDFYENFYRLKRQIESRPLILGGTSGEDGGSGGPAGGFIGWLPQNRVAYDSTQASSNVIPPSGASLIDNLNYIRWRIDNIIVSGGMGTPLEVEWDDSSIREGVDIINFEGNVSVSDEGLGKVTVTIPEIGRVKRSVTDTTPGFLASKLVAGTNVSFETVNSGANEQIRINSTFTVSGGLPGTVYATGNDVVPGYIDEKVRTDEGIISSIEIDETTGEYLNLRANFLSLPDTPSSYTEQSDKWLKVNITGDGIEFANLPESNQDPVDEKIKISLEDQISDYLENKLVAGTNVGISKQNVGGNEQLRISASVTVSGELSNLNIQHNDANVAPGVTILNFEGDVSVVEDEAGKATVTISGGGTGGVNEFTDLTDTPSAYTGHGEKVVRVNTGETGLEFYELSVSGGGISLEDHLAIGNDAPHHAPVTLGVESDPALSLSGQELTLTLPSVSGSGATTFLELTDTPITYSGNEGRLLSVNQDADGVEFIVPIVSGSGMDMDSMDFMRTFPYYANDFYTDSTNPESYFFPFKHVNYGRGNVGRPDTADANELNHPGIVRFSNGQVLTGETTNAGSSLYVGHKLTNQGILRLVPNAEMEAIIKFGNGQSLYYGMMGYMGVVTDLVAEMPFGVYFWFTASTIEGIARNVGGTTNTTTSYPISYQAGWLRLRLKINEDRTRADFYLYDDDTGELLWTDYVDSRLPNTSGTIVYYALTAFTGMENYTGFGTINVDWLAVKLRGSNELSNIIGGLVGSSYKSKITSSDAIPNYLGNKLVAGTNVNISVLNPGGEEGLIISADPPGGGTDGKVLVEEGDLLRGYLGDKITASGILLTEEFANPEVPAEGKILNLSASFTSLPDTPYTFSEHAGKNVVVNAEGTALEFVTPPASGATNFLGLTDTPATYTANSYIKANSGATALENGAFIGTFRSLTDTPNSFPYPGYMLKINNGISALEWVAPSITMFPDTPSTLVGDRFLRTNIGGTAVELVDLAWSGGGVVTEPMDFMRQFPWLGTEFSSAGTATAVHNPPFIFTAISSGTFATYGFPEAKHPGVCYIRSSANTNSGALVKTENSSFRLVSGMRYELIFKVPNATTSVKWLGFLDTTSATTPSTFAGVSINELTLRVAGRRSSGGSLLENIDTYTLSTSVWYRLSIVVSGTNPVTSQAAQFDVYLYNDDNDLLFTDRIDNSNYIPDQTLGAGISAYRATAGATDLIYLDWLAVRVRDEEITIANLEGGTTGSGSGTDELVRVSATDDEADYLLYKLEAGSGITITKSGSGGYEKALISRVDSTTFTDLTDTPSIYTDQGGKILRVNFGEEALEFVSPEVASSYLLVEEEDGIPTISGVTQIIVPSGSLLDLGEGRVQLDFLQRPTLDSRAAYRQAPVMSVDWLVGTTAALNLGWTFTSQTSGTVAHELGDENIGHPGIARINSASATSGMLIRTTNSIFPPSTPNLYYEIIFKLFPSANILGYMGFSDQINLTSVFNFIDFYISPDLNLQGRTRIGSPFSVNFTTTTYTITPNVWYSARLQTNDDATQVDYYLYNDSGTLLWHDFVDNSSFPTSSLTALAAFYTFNGSAASPLAYIDLITAIPNYKLFR